MELVAKYWHIILSVITLIFTFGKLWQKIIEIEKMIIPTKDVQIKIQDEIEKQLKNHCPFHNDIAELKTKINGYDAWIKSHEKFAAEANEANHLLLQELVINTQNICENIGIKYLKKNGK